MTIAELVAENEGLLRLVDAHVDGVTALIANHASRPEKGKLLEAIAGYHAMVRSELCSIGRLAENVESDETRERTVREVAS